MDLITHQIIIHDEGLPSQRCALRSSCSKPQRQGGYMPDELKVEDGLPTDTSDYLIELMKCHGIKLAREVGESWLTYDRGYT